MSEAGEAGRALGWGCPGLAPDLGSGPAGSCRRRLHHLSRGGLQNLSWTTEEEPGPREDQQVAKATQRVFRERSSD